MNLLSPIAINKVTATSIKTGYRPDIDGLRAIAVLSVIFYHFDVAFFSGGFVGVDIFFVISGYLITKGVIDKQNDGKFEFSDFYSRRVRRLIPALLATISASYVAAFILFSPPDFKQMSGSTVYALSGISNIFFWLESGYFDSASIVKPLLHTWSLSVEIQFYILWPIILLLITWLTKHKFIATLSLTISGCAAAVLYLDIDSSGAFFLTPFRMHEFILGGLVVFLERTQAKKYFSDAAYIIGLLLVAYSVFFFGHETTLFPGFAALIPASGAALMIIAGKNTRFATPCTSNVAIKIGELSYSLYLVHWPIFVFTSYVLIDDVSTSVTIALIFATFFLAWALYSLIEKPFRNPKKSRLTGTGFSLATLVLSTAITITASSSWGNDGWPWRLPEELQTITKINKPELERYTWEYFNHLNSKSGFEQGSNKEKILIIGDSQAADIANMINESGTNSSVDIVSRVIYTDCATPYLESDEHDAYFTKINELTIKRPELVTLCKDAIARATNKELIDSADKIFIAFQWRTYANEYNIRAIKKIASMTKSKILVFGRKDLSKSSIDIASSHGRLLGISNFAARFKNKETLEMNQLLSKISGIKFIDMMEIICPSTSSCVVLTENNSPVFFDSAHLTKGGAKFLSPSLLEKINAL